MPQGFPPEFESILMQSLPGDEVAPLLDSLEWPALTAVRLNPAKGSRLLPELELTKVPWSPDTLLLKHRPEFIADPALHAGYYYVQEASSAVIGTVARLLLEDAGPVTVLDLCAAPGGKSTHLSSVLRSGDLLVANEVIHSRTPVLHENLCKWGDARHIITRADAARIGQCSAAFDLILADMPCSGEGMFRKDPGSMDEWSPDHVSHCALRQNRIASEIWPALKSGGYFIYSTCTYNRTENEDNVNKICRELGAEVLLIPELASMGFYTVEEGMYRLMPHRQPGEGFFFAVLRKTADNAPRQLATSAERRLKYRKATAPDGFGSELFWYGDEDDLYVINSENSEKLFALLQDLPAVYAAGTPAGKWLRKKSGMSFKPGIALSLLSHQEHQPYPLLEVSDADVMKFLRRETLSNPAKSQGIRMVQWRGLNMGYVNGTGNTFNNLWPMEWRIRKEGLSTRTILQLD